LVSSFIGVTQSTKDSSSLNLSHGGGNATEPLLHRHAGNFPAGLVIYWAWNNSLSVTQQSIIMRRHGAKIELWDNVKKLFVGKKKAAGS
jgi:hypothetical protein